MSINWYLNNIAGRIVSFKDTAISVVTFFDLPLPFLGDFIIGRIILNIIWIIWDNKVTIIIRPVEAGGLAGLQPPAPQNFATFSFYELKKIVLKWKIVQSYKTSWNSSKVIDIYNITIELNNRDGLFRQ